MVRRFRPDIATDLQADVGARHVIKAGAVEAADFNVLYWVGLDRKIRCLPSRNRNQTGRGAEEEAFHHLHLAIALAGVFMTAPENMQNLTRGPP